MILTHCPFEPTPDSPDCDPESPGSKTYKGEARYFGDMVSYMDKLIGKVIQKLEDQGLRENTLVVFVGDNGTDIPVVSMLNGEQVAGADLEIIETPGFFRCRDCLLENEFDNFFAKCPCGSSNLACIAGEELKITEMEVA